MSTLFELNLELRWTVHFLMPKVSDQFGNPTRIGFILWTSCNRERTLVIWQEAPKPNNPPSLPERFSWVDFGVSMRLKIRCTCPIVNLVVATPTVLSSELPAAAECSSWAYTWFAIFLPHHLPAFARPPPWPPRPLFLPPLPLWLLQPTGY